MARISINMLNILIVCTGNSCRSIIGEAVFNHLGQGRIKAFSAGSNPKGRVNTGALNLLQRHELNTRNLSSKSWDILENQPFNIVITVCDNAAQETCPVYLSSAVKIHWTTAEPSHTKGGDNEILNAFEQTYKIFEQRIATMLALPLDKMNRTELTRELNAIE